MAKDEEFFDTTESTKEPYRISPRFKFQSKSHGDGWSEAVLDFIRVSEEQ